MGIISEKLNRINSSSPNGLRELYGVFHSIPDNELPIVRFTIYSGSSLIRQRVNKPGDFFRNVSDLSYPPAAVTPMQRANLPEHPMFYACSFPSEINESAPVPRLIALEETSSFLMDKSSSGIERATVSRWDVVKPLELIALPFLGPYKRVCTDIIKINQGWEEAISKGPVPQDALELVNYMAKEISIVFIDKSQYFRIANFVFYLLTMNTKTKDADGIIYPSVPAGGAGFNVAIKPAIADFKIAFSNASVCHCMKRGMEATIITISDAIVDEYGHITYEKRAMDKQMEAYYYDMCNGLAFVN